MSDIREKYSAGGVVYSDGKFLTIHVTSHNEVVFPKGGVDPGETPEQAAVREVREETGYRAVGRALLDKVTYEFDEDDGYRYRKTVHYYLMELVDKDEEPVPDRQPGEEVFENMWLTADEALERLTHDDNKELLRRALVLLEQETNY